MCSLTTVYEKWKRLILQVSLCYWNHELNILQLNIPYFQTTHIQSVCLTRKRLLPIEPSSCQHPNFIEKNTKIKALSTTRFQHNSNMNYLKRMRSFKIDDSSHLQMRITLHRLQENEWTVMKMVGIQSELVSITNSSHISNLHPDTLQTRDPDIDERSAEIHQRLSKLLGTDTSILRSFTLVSRTAFNDPRVKE